MRGTRGTVLLVVLAILTIGTAGYALERTPPQTTYNGPAARPFVSDHEAYPQVAFIGDSYTGGSDMGGRGPAGWPALLTTAHRWYPDIVSAGGSGYIVGGTADQPFPKQLPKAVAFKPQLLIIWASRNDIPRGADAIGQAADQLFGDVKRELPQTKVVVIGPAWINGNATSIFYDARDAEKAAADKAGFLFIDPLAEDWFGGDAAKLIGSDGVHPTDDGHRHIAELVDGDLRKLGITSLPKPPQL